jgi:hypothetical protein
MKGAAACNIENALAAAGAQLALASRKPRYAGAYHLPARREDNPAGSTCFRWAVCKVMLDYGHNIAGYDQVIGFLQNRAPGGWWASIACPATGRRGGEESGGAVRAVLSQADYQGRQGPSGEENPGEIAGLSAGIVPSPPKTPAWSWK